MSCSTWLASRPLLLEEEPVSHTFLIGCTSKADPIVVTGIGLMITLALVENGCKVFITSRDKSKLEDVVRRYSGDGKERGEIVP